MTPALSRALLFALLIILNKDGMRGDSISCDGVNCVTIVGLPFTSGPRKDASSPGGAF